MAKENENTDSWMNFGGDDKPKIYIPLINFPDFGIALQARQIANIEKEDRLKEMHLEDKWQYGITINRGVPPSIKYPRTNVSIWYDDFRLRDQRYEQILQVLEDSGFNIITV